MFGIYDRTFSSQSSRNCVESVGVNIHIVMPHGIQLNHVFSENYASVDILSRDIFISMFVKESHDRVRRCDFLDVLYSNLQPLTNKTRIRLSNVTLKRFVLLLHIREAPGSISDLEAGYSDWGFSKFFQFLHVSTGMIL
jgi:hypothetical protein